jgi:hypothetical protein
MSEQTSNAQVLVDLASVAVLLEQPPEDTHAPHPLDLRRETSVGSTLPLTLKPRGGEIGFSDMKKRKEGERGWRTSEERSPARGGKRLLAPNVDDSPAPVWRPLRLAARRSRVRAREWTTVGFLML